MLTGTGITVSRACLGGMTFGREVEEAAAVRMVHTALDAGVNFVDTADVYAGGLSEEILGRALQGKRDAVVLASKVGRLSAQSGDPHATLHRGYILQSVEKSLRRLQTDRLDILYLHRPDRRTPLEETLASVDRLIGQGKVMYLGMSNYAAWQVGQAVAAARTNHWEAPVVTQYPYNLITRSLDEEAVEFLTSMRVGLVVYNPLAAGLLSGKHSVQDGPLDGTRLAANPSYYRRYWNDRNLTAIERLKGIAEKNGKTLIELSLQWLASRPPVDSIIIGATKPEHLVQNLQALDERLDEGVMRACDEVWSGIRGEHFSYHR